MKERKYKEDWVNETRFDDKTGKETRVPVYRGDWFRLSAPQSKRALILEALIPWVGFAVLLILYFKLNFPGATVMYVFLPAALSLFPLLYWVLGITALFRMEGKMTRLQKENGIGRVLRSAAGCAIFSLAALIGNTVFLFVGSQASREWPGSLMLLVAFLLACATVSRFRAKNRLTVREEASA